MASIGKDPGGQRRILFVDADGSRKTIRLGKVSQRDADTVCRHVEALSAARISGQPLPRDTALWLSTIGRVLHERLVRAGLAEPIQRPDSMTLINFLDEYIASRSDVKASTARHFANTRRDLVGFFGGERRLADISPGDADEFRRQLLRRLSENTVRRRCGRAKQFFRAALRKRLIAENPFGDMKGCNVQANRQRDYFLSRTDAAKILEACPDVQWRLIFALSRYGGLRCPPSTWR